MVIDRVLERRTPILLTTRLKKPKRKKISRGIHADKQNLEETFSFGQALLDICDGLSINALWGPLPVQITLRTQQTLVEWSGLMPPEELRWFNPQTSQQHFNAKKAPQLRAAYSEDRTLRTRFSLVNLRIEAEMLIFMCQTGMNLSQAHQLRYEQFSFKSIINGFEARSYKHRRGGSVLFEIFDDYKQVFKRYLAWRNDSVANCIHTTNCNKYSAKSQSIRGYFISKLCNRQISIQAICYSTADAIDWSVQI